MKACRAVLIGLFPLLSHATDYRASESGIVHSAAQAQDCFNLADNRRINECVGHFHSESEAALEATLKAIRSRLARDRALLDDAQAKWLAFKNSECEVRSISARAFRDPDSQKQLFSQACTAEMNAARVVQLKNIPLGCDSCLQ